MGNHEKALYFASKHLEISKEVCSFFLVHHVALLFWVEVGLVIASLKFFFSGI
jgi:hypothetical protein